MPAKIFFAVLQQGGLFRQRFIFAGNQAGLVDLISLEAVEVHLLQVIPLLSQQTVQLSLNLVISLVGLVKSSGGRGAISAWW